MQKRDRLFAAQDRRRFKTSQMKKSRCTKLVVGGVTIQDPETLLAVWVEHFQKQGELRLGDTPEMFSWIDKMQLLEIQSHKNEEFLLDVPFTAEEVSGAVNRLKMRKALGLDGLIAEHIKAGGDAMITWSMKF